MRLKLIFINVLLYGSIQNHCVVMVLNTEVATVQLTFISGMDSLWTLITKMFEMRN